MILNKQIPNEISQWQAEHNQNEFLTNENWLRDAYPTEDILQIQHKTSDGPVLDVGFYGSKYKIYVIYDQDWDNPAEVFESADSDLVSGKVYELLKEYADGKK